MSEKVKITVLKRLHHPDLVEQHCTAAFGPCNRLHEGQEFVCEGVSMPPGFCDWAWCDIQKYVMTLATGGDFSGVDPGVFIASCTDGLRPVVFKLERINDEGTLGAHR